MSVKALLVARETEVAEVLEQLREKEAKIVQLEKGWEQGEEELRRMRKEVVARAQEVQHWKNRMMELAAAGDAEELSEEQDEVVRAASLAAAKLQVQVRPATPFRATRGAPLPC